jgi:ABC-type sugar transport system substrate-binding protein
MSSVASALNFGNCRTVISGASSTIKEYTALRYRRLEIRRDNPHGRARFIRYTRWNVRIVVIAPQEPAAFFDLLWQGVWEATFDIAQFGVEVANVTPLQHGVEAQRSILADLLHERVNAIAIVPVHGSALDDLIGQHVDRGTSVITSIPTPLKAGGRYL